MGRTASVGKLLAVEAALPEIVAALAAAAARHDSDGSFPHEAFDLLGRHGILALVVPSELGGSGAGLHTAVRVLVQLGRGDPSVALVTALTCKASPLTNVPEILRRIR